jgi:hypothetical protein
MAAALVEGIEFQQDRRGYWTPCERGADHANAHQATDILREVVTALHFPSIERYLRRCGSHPAEVQARIAALQTEQASRPPSR